MCIHIRLPGKSGNHIPKFEIGFHFCFIFPDFWFWGILYSSLLGTAKAHPLHIYFALVEDSSKLKS